VLIKKLKLLIDVGGKIVGAKSIIAPVKIAVFGAVTISATLVMLVFT
jgi:hypothetical protein